MKIPDKVKVGGKIYTVSEVNHEICVDNKEVCGRIDYHKATITIRNDFQDAQGMAQTFMHELIHAMARERGLEWGDNDELYTEELAKALHQVVVDNPDLFK